ncbi:MAG: helix-hairpin-helix domain-containing protein [Eggerthellaceae bacterium]|nr:helix-hairpin-helix domain-containing protein [Eggerthellaceae bacterium]
MVAVLAGRNLIGTATATEFAVPRSAAASQPAESVDAAPQSIYVHVSGAVASPGLYELEEGSRVASAVEAAGGFADDAAPESVNLARKLEDGEMVVVSRKSEVGVEAAAQGGEAGETGSTGIVNINTASEAELETLPGIGPTMAQRIVSDRKANGAYKTVDDLKRVSGIGDRKFESLSGLICV